VGTAAEILLISSVIANGDYQVAVAHNITPEMFHVCPDEWQFIEQYHGRYRKTPSTRAFSLKFPHFNIRRGLDDTGYQADQTRREHVIRYLDGHLNEVIDDLTAGDVETAVKKMSHVAVQAAAQTSVHRDTNIFTDYADIKSEAQARMNRVAEFGMAGIPTGIGPLDDMTGGQQPGELNIHGARMNTGKSWIITAAAATAALNDFNVLIYSLEMPRALVAYRIHSYLHFKLRSSPLDAAALTQGRGYDPVQYGKFLDQISASVSGRIHVSDSQRGQIGPLEVAAGIERNQPDIVFIDHIGLMRGGVEWQAIAERVAQLKQLGLSYRLPITCAAQLNRSRGTGQNPDNDAFAGSDAIPQDADFACMWVERSTHVLQGSSSKHRNGRRGHRFYLHFDPANGVIEHVSGDRAEELISEDRLKGLTNE
jgi:replicative DNA helicase